MTAPAVHLWRLLKWGRILARHGALRGLEHDPNTPAPVRRLARIAGLALAGAGWVLALSTFNVSIQLKTYTPPPKPAEKDE